MSENDSLEAALSAMEREADATIRSLSAALKDAKKVKAAAATGQMRDLRAAVDATIRSSESAADGAKRLQESWSFDEATHFSSGAYAKEVLSLASNEQVSVFESDDRILCYPAIIQVSAGDYTVLIDKAKDRRIRPSVLVRLLKAIQSRPPKFKAEAFLESLAAGYDLVLAKSAGREESVVKLVDVYGVLTVLPGLARDYTKQEFARDLYLLDQSGVVTTKNGRTLSLPASALTRGSGVLTTVSRSGQEKVYAGIALTAGPR